MAFGGVVQTAEATVASGAVTVSFDAATAGNLLIFVVGRSTRLANDETWGAPSGWTAIQETPAAPGGSLGGVWYYKIAAGGETSVTSAESAAPGNGRGVVVEYEGAFDGSTPLDVSAEDETNLGTAVTSQATGTTGTTAQADELAVAVFVTDAASTWDTGRSYSNSFTEDIFASASVATGRPACIAAHRVLSSTGTVTTTISTTDTGDEAYGSIATFKKGSSGGTQYNQSASGGITPAGAEARETRSPKSGAVSPTGAVSRSVAKTFAGALTSAGAAIRQTTKSAAGALTSSGALTMIKAALLSVGGTLTGAGGLTRQTGKAAAGTLTQAGALVRRVAKSMGGALTPSGVLTSLRAFFMAVAGTLSSVGSLSRATAKQVGGALNPAGAISREITRIIAGTLSMVGAVIAQSSGEVGIGPGLRRVWHVLLRQTGIASKRNIRAANVRETHQVKERGVHGD